LGEDPVLRDAVLHRLVLMGEIARAVSGGLREGRPEAPWAHMRAFRDTAIHEYFAVDWSRVQRIAVTEVPELETTILTVLKQEFPEIAGRFEERG
jgi:uncharacterized protein with HEPN domain